MFMSGTTEKGEGVIDRIAIRYRYDVPAFTNPVGFFCAKIQNHDVSVKLT
jgi:hypothetical protein